MGDLRELESGILKRSMRIYFILCYLFIFAAKQGRAQMFSNNLLIQDEVPVSLLGATIGTNKTVSRLFAGYPHQLFLSN